MARPAAYTDTLLARVRRHFGLRQAEVAALLGISPAQANYLEAGRRALTRAVAERLAPFLAALEAADAVLLPTAPPPGAFDAAPLERRRAACLHEAHNLRWQLRALPEQAAVAARWAEALPGLRAALPPPPPADAAPATREAARLRYVHGWLATVPPALPPETLAEWHLGHQRALALEAEAAALGALLAGAVAGPH